MTIYDKHSPEGAEVAPAGSEKKSNAAGRKYLRRGMLFVLLPLLAVLGVVGVASAQNGDDRGGARSADRHEVLADLFGLTSEEVVEALKSGSTLAELAEANGVSEQELVDALTAGITARAEAHDKELTEEQIAAAQEKIQARVDGDLKPSDFDKPGAHRHGKARHRAVIGQSDVLTELFGLTRAEVFEALKSGSTLAELAEANGVSEQELVDALTAGITARAEAHDKELTEEQIAAAREKIQARVDGDLKPSDIDTDRRGNHKSGRGFFTRGSNSDDTEDAS